jgi:hypothetical protein
VCIDRLEIIDSSVGRSGAEKKGVEGKKKKKKRERCPPILTQ